MNRKIEELLREGMARHVADTPASAGMAARTRRARRRKQLTSRAGLMVGAFGTAAAVAAVASVPGHLNPPARGGAITARLTARQVLDKAAAAALSEPGVTPRPDQFVYTKQTDGAGHVSLTWESVDGSRNGLEKGDFVGGSDTTTIQGCVNGERKIRLPGRNGKRLRVPPHKARTPITLKSPVPMDGPVVTEPCAAQPAFFPDMPTRASAMPAYLARAQGIRLNDTNSVAKTVGEIFEFDYLLPAQRAAMYQFLATTPGLTVEHNAQNISGRPGIGIRWSFEDGDDLLIFDPNSYALIGWSWRGTNGKPLGTDLVRKAIVNQVNQLP